MAKLQAEQPTRKNQVRAMRNDQGTRSSTLINESSRATKRQAIVHFDLTSNGGWTLRAYSNDLTIERLKLERISKASQQQISATDTTIPSGTTTTLINGVLSKTRNDYASQIKAAGGQSTSRTNAQPVAGNTRSWVRLEDGSMHDPSLIPEGDPLDVDMIEPRITKYFKGTTTSGYTKPYPGEMGRWYFQSVGDGSAEAAAAVNMGDQGIFEPDTSHPTAQNVADYRKCNRAYGTGTDGVSEDIAIVWRPDAWSPAHQEEGANDNADAGIESQGGQDQVDKTGAEEEINQSSSNQALSAQRSPLRGRSPSPPRRPPVPDHEEVVESMEVDEKDDPSKLMPPPARPPATPLEQRKKKSRASNASVMSNQSASRTFEREDTPLPESDRTKRKRMSAEAGSGSSPKAQKITESARTVGSNKPRKTWNTVRMFGDSLRKPNDEKANAMEAEEEVQQDEVDESEEEKE